MRRICTADDPFIGKKDGQHCGITFDDVRYSTICPHESIDGSGFPAATARPNVPDYGGGIPGDLVDRLDQQAAEIAKLRAILMRHQWNGANPLCGRASVCPQCEVEYRYSDEDATHDPTCALAALLEETTT